jgi:hypothetical protein
VDTWRIGSVVASIALYAALFAAMPAMASEAENEHNRFEITPFVGSMAGGEFEDPADDSERDLDGGTSRGLIVDIAAEHWRHYEFFYSDLDTEVEGETPFDMSVRYLQIGGIVSHPEMRRVIPYFGMTIGAAQFSPDEPGLDDETKFAFTAGGGLRIPITEHFGVRFDARAFVTVLDSEGDLFCVSDAAGAACRIRAKSDTFVQYAASLGVIVGF